MKRIRKARRTSIPALFISLLALSVSAAPTLELDPSSRLWIEGESTLHPYSSTATRLDIQAVFDPSPKTLLSGTDARLELVVPIDGLRSGKEGLDKNMRRALKAQEHPEIRFRMTGYEVGDSSAPDSFPARVLGELTLAGRMRPVELKARLEPSPQGLRVRGSQELLMTDFGIAPPSMFMGTLKTADRVVIRYDVLLEKRLNERGSSSKRREEP